MIRPSIGQAIPTDHTGTDLAGDEISPDDPETRRYRLSGGRRHDTVRLRPRRRDAEAANRQDTCVADRCAFLGLTVNCARCHDHKFDPIPQRDYYRMQAAFAGVQHAERDLTTHEERIRREAQEKPLREDLERVTQHLAAIKQSAWPLEENHRAEIAKRYRQPVDPKGNEENFAPISARFVRMTILATYQNQEPALDELEVWTSRKTSHQRRPGFTRSEGQRPLHADRRQGSRFL